MLCIISGLGKVKTRLGGRLGQGPSVALRLVVQMNIEHNIKIF